MGGDVGAVVPAAGLGRRMGGGARKPFVPVCGKPLVAHALLALQRSRTVRWIQLVARVEDHARLARLVVRYGITKALPPVTGGASREASVARGVAGLPPEARWVVVHDGARPCVTPALIDRVVARARREGPVACGWPASITIKQARRDGVVRATLDRSALWLAQTPQVVPRAVFAAALARFRARLARFPDDVSVLEAAGCCVRMVPGTPWNIKVTTRDDLVLAEAILRRRG